MICGFVIVRFAAATRERAGSSPAHFRLVAALLAAFCATSAAGQGAKPPTQAPISVPAPIAQIRKEIPGDFLYRLVSKAGISTAPAPLPAADAQSGIVALPLPDGAKLEDTRLEVIDIGRGNLAELPLAATGAAPQPLTEADFSRVHMVSVPVQSKGRFVVAADVSIESKDHKAPYLEDVVLQQGDQGVATFRGVPLGVPVTMTVRFGANPPVSQTRTITRDHPSAGYRWPTVDVDWADVTTIAPPATPQAPAPVAAPPAQTPVRAESGGGFLLNIVSLAALIAICYGVWWAYTNDRIKPMLEKLGIATPAAGVGDSQQISVFTSTPTTRLQPITEGTADPFSGGGSAFSPTSARQSDGPRLIGTVGAYAGSIFPLSAGATEIGREETNTVSLSQDAHTSRRHASISRSDGGFQIIDNGSANGTYVNGVRVAAQSPQPLRAGDEIQIGQTRFRFEA